MAKSDRPDQPAAVQRPWIPVAIASAIAAALLLFLWIPGVLIYPNIATARRDPIDPNLVAQTRETLEQRFEAGRLADARQACPADAGSNLDQSVAGFR